MTTGRPALVTRALRPPVRSPRAIPRLAPGLLAAVALTGLLGLAPVALSSGFSRPAPSVALSLINISAPPRQAEITSSVF